MPVDIYKKVPIVTPSGEHVLLDSLGGRLESPAILDKTTNDVFGSTIDAALADVLLPFRVFLDARAGDGRQAPPLRRTTTAAGDKYNVLPGGKPEMAAPRLHFEKTEKGVVVRDRVRNMKVSPEAVLAGARVVEERVPMLEFGPEAWRAILTTAAASPESKRGVGGP